MRVHPAGRRASVETQAAPSQSSARIIMDHNGTGEDTVDSGKSPQAGRAGVDTIGRWWESWLGCGSGPAWRLVPLAWKIPACSSESRRGRGIFRKRYYCS